MGTRRLISRGDDERRQTSERFGEAHERMSEEFGRRESAVDVDLEAVIKEVLKHRRQLVSLFDLRLAVRRYQIQRLHRTDQPSHDISHLPATSSYLFTEIHATFHS